VLSNINTTLVVFFRQPRSSATWFPSTGTQSKWVWWFIWIFWNVRRDGVRRKRREVWKLC